MLDYLRRRPTTTAELDALDIQWRQNIEAYKANIQRECELMDATLDAAFDEVRAAHSNQPAPVRIRNESVSELVGGVEQ